MARITTTMRFAIAIGYKKNRSASQQFAVRWVHDSPLPLPPQAPLKKGQPYLLFLVSISPSTYETADPFLGMSPFSIVPTGPTTGGFSGLEMALAQIVVQADRQDRLRALRLLQGFDLVSKQTLALMRRIADSDDFEIALTAWAVLLKTKSPDAVAGLSEYLNMHPLAIPLAIPLATPQTYLTYQPVDALIGVQEGLSAIRDERALKTLEQLASSKYFEIRTGALYALRGMKDPRSAQTLIQRLDDERSDLQYLALITLNEIFNLNEDYGPSMKLFDEDPQKYIALWKEWWQETRK